MSYVAAKFPYKYGMLLSGVICRTVISIPWKIYIWSVEHNSYRGSDRTMETGRASVSNQSELPQFRRVEPERTPAVQTGRTMETQW